MLHDDQCVAADLCDLDDNNDKFACYYASSWFQTCRITLDLLGKALNLDDVVLKDKIKQSCGSHAIDEVGPFTHRKRYK